jgi:hypothetical protein
MQCDPGEGLQSLYRSTPSSGLLRNPTSPRWGEVDGERFPI